MLSILISEYSKKINSTQLISFKTCYTKSVTSY